MHTKWCAVWVSHPPTRNEIGFTVRSASLAVYQRIRNLSQLLASLFHWRQPVKIALTQLLEASVRWHRGFDDPWNWWSDRVLRPAEVACKASLVPRPHPVKWHARQGSHLHEADLEFAALLYRATCVLKLERDKVLAPLPMRWQRIVLLLELIPHCLLALVTAKRVGKSMARGDLFRRAPIYEQTLLPSWSIRSFLGGSSTCHGLVDALEI